ncbi:MAG: peptidyl-prolyl cis-trans isomerase [Candidatus Marinimicrobia bacterium]|nr:peptidyl-prolyl cis-trans isomerase [Candidatus Neomarinimicrobiota bacterium]
MKKVNIILLVALAVNILLSANVNADQKGNEMVKELGQIVIQLNAEAAPKTVENFLNYCESGFYEGTIFHRVIPNFMIQGGGLTPDMNRKQPNAPIQNEADNGLKNKRGTIAMARTRDPHSATSQFFINTEDNRQLNFKAKNSRGWGYCVFGKVSAGMEIVDKIEKVKTHSEAGRQNVPVTDIIIDKVKTLEDNQVSMKIIQKQSDEE